MSLKLSQQNLPPSPGVYIFRDQNNRVLYVGKAKNLQKRVVSYFRPLNLAPDKKLMMSRAQNLEHIVVDNETEALLLENNLIKKYRPPYNVVFKDDKSYVYLKITNENFPRVFLDHGRGKSSKKIKKVFGPYTATDQARATLKFVRQIFPFRSCLKMPKHICLYSHLRLCSAPCETKISQIDYQKDIAEIIRFLRGQHQEIIQETKKAMQKASIAENFEKAAILRDRLIALQNVQAKQKIITDGRENQDIISLARAKKQTAINLFIIRDGHLLGKKNFLLEHTYQKPNSEILQSFIQEYYFNQEDYPSQIILSVKIPALLNLKIIVPQKGKKHQLLKMGAENARQFLTEHFQKKKIESIKNQKILAELASYLKLKKPPKRIEAYDISNIQGVDAVGSMIVFVNGLSDKKNYRRFKIKTVSGANDVGMMREILIRRFNRSENKKQTAWPLPDLIILDGGKGQLNAALSVLKEKELQIPARALAKKLEEIYFPNQKNPFSLPRMSQSLMLLKRIRDEAHRFAIAYHHKLRGKGLLNKKTSK